MLPLAKIRGYWWNRNNNLHDVESEDQTSSSKMEATVLSCNNFLLLSALFLLKVASISKSRGTRLPVGDLCIQNTDRNSGYPIQEETKNKQKQIFTSNKRVTNRHLKIELNFPNRKKFPESSILGIHLSFYTT